MFLPATEEKKEISCLFHSFEHFICSNSTIFYFIFNEVMRQSEIFQTRKSELRRSREAEDKLSYLY